MKVLGISGSHRKGNTDFLVKYALGKCEKSGLQTSFISLAEKDIGFCRDCDFCRKHDVCVIDDDLNPILEEMKKSDAIIVGSPVYFGGMTGKLKAVLDRTLPLRRQGLMLSKKIGGAISIGGSRNGGQELTIQNIHAWMLINEMIVVGDKGTAHFGGAVVGRNPGDAEKDEIGLKTVEGLAEKIVETLERLDK
ncbi:MAG: flavodoxin family protein [Candidatus Altiarchaeota archaeon]